MKWVNGVLAMLCYFDDWLKYCVHCHIALYSMEIADDPQTNDELNTELFSQGTNL